MNKLITCTLVIALAVTAVSCKKKNTLPPHYDYTFINSSGASLIHATVYGSEEDYINQTNPIKKVDLPLQQRIDGSSGLIEDHEYYVDYYSDDFSVSNWIIFYTAKMTGDFRHFGYFKYKKGDSVLFANPGFTINKVMLNGNKTTSWHAVDAYNYNNNASVWDKLSAYEKNVVLNCSFQKLEIIHQDTSGKYNTTTLPMTEIIARSCRPGMYPHNEGGIFQLSFDTHDDIYIYNINQPPKGSWTSTYNLDEYKATSDSVFLRPDWTNYGYVFKRD